MNFQEIKNFFALIKQNSNYKKSMFKLKKGKKLFNIIFIYTWISKIRN